MKVKEGIVSMLGTSRATAFICAKISSLMTANLSSIKKVLPLQMNRPILLLYLEWHTYFLLVFRYIIYRLLQHTFGQYDSMRSITQLLIIYLVSWCPLQWVWCHKILDLMSDILVCLRMSSRLLCAWDFDSISCDSLAQARQTLPLTRAETTLFSQWIDPENVPPRA